MSSLEQFYAGVLQQAQYAIVLFVARAALAVVVVVAVGLAVTWYRLERPR